MAYTYLGPAVEFTHNGQTYKPGDSVDIDDRTAEIMSRYGHRFEGFGQAVAGTPLEGYSIDVASSASGGAGTGTAGLAPVRGQTAADLIGPQNDQGGQPAEAIPPDPNAAPAPAVQVTAPPTTPVAPPTQVPPMQASPVQTQQVQSPPTNANAPAQG